MPAVASCGPLHAPPQQAARYPERARRGEGYRKARAFGKRGLPLDRQGFSTTSVGAPKQRVHTETPVKPERTARGGAALQLSVQTSPAPAQQVVSTNPGATLGTGTRGRGQKFGTQST